MRRKEERKEGTFRIVIGAREVISDLKSSRCEPAPEKEKEAWRWRDFKREREKEGDLTRTGLLPLQSSVFTSETSSLRE